MSELIQKLLEDIGAVFRHVFPGVLVILAAYVRRPEWFVGLTPEPTWPQLIVVLAAALALGNLAYAGNRYGLLHILEWAAFSVRGRRCMRLRRTRAYAIAVGREMERFYRDEDKVRRLIRFRDAASVYLLVGGEASAFAAYDAQGVLEELSVLLWFMAVILLLGGILTYLVSRLIVRQTFVGSGE